ncbi:hypothetical protein [Kitasatospora sp. NPDC088346]|uniref:hypothetical protein n=1 Tax=Kitasatospora sp. NPDC088346 TaxID=3364073 RepID=UPI0037F87B98
MSGIPTTLKALHDGERRLEHDLLAAAERHRTEPEVHHVATDVARWSRESAALIAALAPHYGLDLSGQTADPGPGLWATVREKTAEALGRRPETGLLLLHDLRDLHLAATENSLHWDMLTGAAQAGRDTDLLGLVTCCHPRTLRQMRWTSTMIRILSPQLLTSI